MHLCQHAFSRLYHYYTAQRSFERNNALVYLDDYILGWLVHGDGIESCGRDFGVLMQMHSLVLMDLAVGGSIITDYFDEVETDDGQVIPRWEYDELVKEQGLEDPEYEFDQRRRDVKHCHDIKDALGVFMIDQKTGEMRCPDSRAWDWETYSGSLHPAFTKEWFDYLAELAPEVRREQWRILWQAREAVTH